MINLADYLGNENLFDGMAAIGILPAYLNDNREVLNRLLILKYGGRSVFGKFENMTIPDIAEMIVLIHANSWNELVKVKSLDINAKSLRTITETTINSENKVNVNDSKNMVSAYDTDDLIVNDGSLVNNSDDINGTVTRTMTDEFIDVDSAYNNFALSVKNDIIDVVLKDVSSFMTLNIY